MTDSYYQLSDMCATCGERYGRHCGLSCFNGRGSFVLAAKPANGPESYHYRASLDDYFTRAAEQANWLVFPSGAAVLTSGDKIVGRVEAEPAYIASGTYSAKRPSGVTVTILGAGGASYSKPVEPIRPALDWDTATPFDPFGADFIVTKGAEPTAPLYDSPTTDSAYPAIAGLLRG